MDEQLQELLLFLWRKDSCQAGPHHPFELAPCLLRRHASVKDQVEGLFDGMLAYMAISARLPNGSRPLLNVVEQVPALASRDQGNWVCGTYEAKLRRITVYVPSAIGDCDRLQIADTLAHEIAHHYLECSSPVGTG